MTSPEERIKELAKKSAIDTTEAKSCSWPSRRLRFIGSVRYGTRSSE
jgi:hypothetical protein